MPRIRILLLLFVPVLSSELATSFSTTTTKPLSTIRTRSFIGRGREAAPRLSLLLRIQRCNIHNTSLIWENNGSDSSLKYLWCKKKKKGLFLLQSTASSTVLGEPSEEKSKEEAEGANKNDTQEPLWLPAEDTTEATDVLSPSGSGSSGRTTAPTTPLQRMRYRKIKILKRRKTIVVGWLFMLWYVLSIAYNIFNKKALNIAPQLAWTAAWVQMSGGLLYVLPLWLFMPKLRQPPVLTFGEKLRLIPVAFLHSLVHIGGVVSMGAGAVSFTYIVKASEPAVSAALSAIFLQKILSIKVYATLIPVMFGVALSSVSELEFNLKSFGYAMMSNVASAMRGIVGKKTLGKRMGQNLTSANLYAVLTIWSTLLLFPITAVLEGNLWNSTIQQLRSTKQLGSYIINLALASFTYYTYNEVSFLCLDEVSPISHAIGNTLKRVAIIISSMLVFGNKMTFQGIVGSFLAIGGVLLYSLLTSANGSKKTGTKTATTTTTTTTSDTEKR